mmetsp:Transcript_89822/g.187760  ORF Transcript_89822/g.187760 Transcript_89822/m.187760 type:complete len:209 (-) Transcript_89822:202-828(-)
MASSEVAFDDLQASLAVVLAQLNLSHLGTCLGKERQGLPDTCRIFAISFDELFLCDHRQPVERHSCVGDLACWALKIVPFGLGHKVLDQAAKMHIFGRAPAGAGAHKEVAVGACNIFVASFIIAWAQWRCGSVAVLPCKGATPADILVVKGAEQIGTAMHCSWRAFNADTFKVIILVLETVPADPDLPRCVASSRAGSSRDTVAAAAS